MRSTGFRFGKAAALRDKQQVCESFSIGRKHRENHKNKLFEPSISLYIYTYTYIHSFSPPLLAVGRAASISSREPHLGQIAFCGCKLPLVCPHGRARGPVGARESELRIRCSFTRWVTKQKSRKKQFMWARQNDVLGPRHVFFVFIECFAGWLVAKLSGFEGLKSVNRRLDP